MFRTQWLDRLALLASAGLLTFTVSCSGSGTEPANSNESSAGDGTVEVPLTNTGGSTTPVYQLPGQGATGTGGLSTQSPAATGGDGTVDVAGTGGGTGSAVSCPSPEEELFSFFMISHEATQRESGNADGFGGDLGGLAGADAICQRVAEYVSPCQANKSWVAFLSTSTVDAIDRIGQGPWHDRNGRLLANSLSELLNDRPVNADPIIINDFPNEYGVPNHYPNSDGVEVDNHQTLTGSGTDGRLYQQNSSSGGGGFPMGGGGGSADCGYGEEQWSVEAATCWDWTSAAAQGCPRVGHSWPGMSGENWISVWNEGGCLPGGELRQIGGLDGSRRVGAGGGYGGWYCFAQRP